MSQYSVLYDELGPRSRRRIHWLTAAISAGCVAVIVLAILRLSERGQFESAKWFPIINPSDPQFVPLWTFLWGGVVNTLLAASLAIVLSLVIGTLIALSRITAHPRYRWLVVGSIEVLRGIPVVLMIFFASRVLPEFGLELPLIFYIVIGLTAYNAVAIAEVIRTGVQNLPRGQSEAASALGLRRSQALRHVILPQAFRQTLPVIVGQVVVILKDTSLGFIIGFEELLRRGQIAIQTLGNPIQVFLVVGLIFISINFALTKLAERIEKGRRAPAASTTTIAEPPAAVKVTEG